MGDRVSGILVVIALRFGIRDTIWRLQGLQDKDTHVKKTIVFNIVPAFSIMTMLLLTSFSTTGGMEPYAESCSARKIQACIVDGYRVNHFWEVLMFQSWLSATEH